MERVDGAKHIEGSLSAAGKAFGVVASRFNDFIVKALLEGALDAVRRHGGDVGSVDVVWVPGSYEVPLAASEMAKSGRYDGRPYHLRRHHHRDHRAGHRTRRHQDGQQGLRGRGLRHRDGRPAAAHQGYRPNRREKLEAPRGRLQRVSLVRRGTACGPPLSFLCCSRRWGTASSRRPSGP